MTIAMFSLIVFSLVMMATMNQNFANLFLGDEANAGWDVRADATERQPDRPTSPAPSTAQGRRHRASFDGRRRRRPTRARTAPQLRLAGDATSGSDWPVRGHGRRRSSTDSDADLPGSGPTATRPTPTIVDGAADRSRTWPSIDVVRRRRQGDFGDDDDAVRARPASTTDDKTFAPITVELADPDGGTPHR